MKKIETAKQLRGKVKEKGKNKKFATAMALVHVTLHQLPVRQREDGKYYDLSIDSQSERIADTCKDGSD